jgi:hypothetical protein
MNHSLPSEIQPSPVKTPTNWTRVKTHPAGHQYGSFADEFCWQVSFQTLELPHHMAGRRGEWVALVLLCGKKSHMSVLEKASLLVSLWYAKLSHLPSIKWCRQVHKAEETWP